MARRLFGLVAAVAGAALATACDQAPPSAPQDVPSFKPVATTNACVFTGNPSLSNAIGAYFVSSADRKTAGDLATLMQTGYNTAPTPNYGAARARGFDLLAFVGKASRTPGAGSSAAAGKVVVQQAIQCMFDVAGNIG
ncbi:MAG TPA: hypothetical protein VMY76_10560, partial [Gemmatimonadales bacterium]|nr:hypothetical protein [Gemmatimonadales bacterium]